CRRRTRRPSADTTNALPVRWPSAMRRSKGSGWRATKARMEARCRRSSSSAGTWAVRASARPTGPILPAAPPGLGGGAGGAGGRPTPARGEILESIPFFQTMDNDERRAVPTLMAQVHVPAGKTMFRENDPGGVLFVLKSGRVELSVVDEEG